MVVVVSMKPQVPDYDSLYRIFIFIYTEERCDIFYVVIHRIIISFLLNFIADGS